MAERRLLALLSLLLPACGGIASAEDLFADSPLTPPPICPQSDGECLGEPGAIHFGPSPSTSASPPAPAPHPGLDGGLS
jgi:hypothetical protein